MTEAPQSKPTVSTMLESEFQDTTQQAPGERTIGEIISQANSLTAEQIEKVLAYQREHGVRFGEAAVALGLASSDDVLWALAQQFHYPYSQDSAKGLHPDLVVANQPFSEQAEGFRTIRSHLIMKLFSDPDQPKQAISVISPDTGDGKSYFAANVAAAFSQLSGKTLLIDADMRNPRQHEIFGLSDKGAGLSTILSGRAASNVIHHVRELPSLYVLPVGVVPPNPLELVERPAFGLLIRELLAKFDRIIVDTPAASLGADYAVIAAKCGAAVMMARRDKSNLHVMQNLSSTARIGQVNLVGVILNDH
ncbi:polysaccharide biosynthesis tyrosine autokinase [Aquabacterium lacunae]|uniref:Polysaccharide biosynthesis tyrosine autokinase n=1 Tax=Aquabacterium lacunae TaxID=2528630 RepID=A0A4Q9GZC6_9BURK|nr:polysaccharide biosynthesis tyrosine autokinase [Aquabacterium lacunae]TBO30195.1 polysaccharide biosynthesis tyrosine autokinase [Aquabacterium lacunae]